MIFVVECGGARLRRGWAGAGGERAYTRRRRRNTSGGGGGRRMVTTVVDVGMWHEVS